MKETTRFSIPELLVRTANVVFGLVTLGLAIRFVLRLFGANPTVGFVSFIYQSTNPLLEPFKGLFTPQIIQTGIVFEFTTLFAIFIYLLALYLIVEFIDYISFHSTTYRG